MASSVDGITEMKAKIDRRQALRDIRVLLKEARRLEATRPELRGSCGLLSGRSGGVSRAMAENALFSAIAHRIGETWCARLPGNLGAPMAENNMGRPRGAAPADRVVQTAGWDHGRPG